ncbi:MAG: T9SS type A sorting domain-containing protein, partial [Candidatus Latescibacteria bacterium]|nr:T9SS type A sorting domain-containing protein [Candidatus Latescibacterota bacterium]
FGLAQNYPNPFNPETTITYDLAAESNIRLEIYNVMGQLVHTLVSDQQAAGRYRVSWLGDNSLGHQVASGVYFYRIQADDFHAVKKLMLLK